MRWCGFVAARDGGASAVLPAVWKGPRAGCFLQIVNVIAVGLLVSACASSQAGYTDYAHVGAPQGRQVAVAQPPPIELEDDGLAVQAPPRVRKNPEQDDPSEPFSPNYGPAPDGVTDHTIDQGHQAPARVTPQHHAQKRPVHIRSRTTPMTPTEAQAIIVQAMIAHERRHP
ncbi:MAG: hypothetical protein JXQ99_29690 [Hyphomicrobiaceae bacterium]